MVVRTACVWRCTAAWLALVACWLVPGNVWGSGSAYVTTGYVPGSVAQFAVGAGGALTPLSPAMVDAAQAPTNVTVSADGLSVYVANREAVTPQQGVTQYDVDPLTGKLSPKTPATVWSPFAQD